MEKHTKTKGSHVRYDCMMTLLIFFRFCSFSLNGCRNHKIEKIEHFNTYLAYKNTKTLAKHGYKMSI